MCEGEPAMQLPEFERMLAYVLPSAQPTSLTLTETPQRGDLLQALLRRAKISGDERRTPLTRIEVPFSRFPDMGALFGGVPVVDTGSAEVVRLFFAP